MQRRALITGVSGQDGSYLADLLLSQQYEVVGTTRDKKRAYERLRAIGVSGKIDLIELAVLDKESVPVLIQKVQPTHLYHLSAPSSVAASFKHPDRTIDQIVSEATNILEAIRSLSPETRYYQASSSEMFGQNVAGGLIDETVPVSPQNPYAIGKACAHHVTQFYRNTYGLFACAGILFNHESPLRALHYVSRKITSGVAQIVSGRLSHLTLGNIDQERDFGFAGDYVRAMNLMLCADQPDDYVIASGERTSIRNFMNVALDMSGVKYAWCGKGPQEQCIDLHSGNPIVRIDQSLYRPVDIVGNSGDATKARTQLLWTPSVDFNMLVSMMLDAERKQLFED